MGSSAAATAREVELTRKRMEEKVAKLSERAPNEVRKLAMRVAYGALTAVALLLTRKLIEVLWQRVTGETPPGKRSRQRD